MLNAMIVTLQFGVYKTSEREYVRIQRLRARFFAGTRSLEFGNAGIARIKRAGFGSIPSRDEFDTASEWHRQCRDVALTNRRAASVPPVVTGSAADEFRAKHGGEFTRMAVRVGQ